MKYTRNKQKYYTHKLVKFLAILCSLFVYVSYISFGATLGTAHDRYGGIGPLFLFFGLSMPIYILYNHIILSRFISRKNVIIMELMLPISFILILLSDICAINIAKF